MSGLGESSIRYGATLASAAIIGLGGGCGSELGSPDEVAQAPDVGSCGPASSVATADPAGLDGIPELTGHLDEWQGFSRAVLVGTVTKATESLIERTRAIEATRGDLQVDVDRVLWADPGYREAFRPGPTSVGYRGYTGAPSVTDRPQICAGDRVLVFAADGGRGTSSDTAYSVVPLSGSGTVAADEAASQLPPEIEGLDVDGVADVLAQRESDRAPRLVRHLDLPLEERSKALVEEQIRNANP